MHPYTTFHRFFHQPPEQPNVPFRDGTDGVACTGGFDGGETGVRGVVQEVLHGVEAGDSTARGDEPAVDVVKELFMVSL